MDLTFKSATQEDIKGLIVVEENLTGLRTYSTTLTQGEWENTMRNGPVYLVNNNEGETVGYISYEIKSTNNAYIRGIVVLPEFQGKGLSKKILSYVLEKIAHIERIDLVTHPENTKAIRLYESLGFTIESRKENYFGDGEPRVIMVLGIK